MNKILTIGVFSLISVASVALSPVERGMKTPSSVYRLSTKADSLILVNDFSAVNSTVEFDLLPQNSSAQVGVLLRYKNAKDWVYVGCNEAADNLGFAVWYVETPGGKIEIARDIAKLYAHHLRHIKVNCIGRTLTVYVDGEQIGHKYIPDITLSSGQTGFRVHDKGNVQISNVVCRAFPEPGKEIAKKRSA